MTAEEMKNEFYKLYDMMAMGQDVKNMQIFGKVHKEMMEWMIQNKPDLAQEWIGKLESIKWRNYLTQKEAEAIVTKMKPEAPWKHDVWMNAMQSLEINVEEEPFYNSCALWVEMNKVYSDHAKSLAEKVWKNPLKSIPTEELVSAIHALAVDNLKDKDGVYSIRSYFGL